MTTVTAPNLPDTLTERIYEISKGDRDLIERDRQDLEQTCFHQHCKRVWQQLNSKERESIRGSVKKESSLFDGAQCSDFLIDTHCINRIKILIRESGYNPSVGNS